MKPHHRLRLVRNGVYLLLAGILVWQGIGLVNELRRRAVQLAPVQTLTVRVQGNVERPGLYRVPDGTSELEILKVAGVRLNSDITPFNLLGQVQPDQTMSVGTLEKPVAASAFGRLEFYLGDVSVIAADGQVKSIQEGMELAEGDRVITEEKSQAELSVNSYSRIDLDNFAELAFDKIGASENGRNVMALFQKSGLCWYKMVYSEKSELFKIATPLGFVTVGGKGADFTIEVKYSEVTIENTDGLLLVERPESNEAINLIAGQSVTLFADKRPFQVAKVAPEVNVRNRFSKLSKLKTDILVTQMPFNFFLCGAPAAYFLVSVQFERNRVVVVHFPAETSIKEFAQGISTLKEAYLYGGPVFASTFVERIMNVRVPKYAALSKGDIAHIAKAMGGIDVTVDPSAAAALQISKGRQRLKGEQIVEFLKPSLSGIADSEQRQFALFQGLFEAFKSRRLIMTALLADQLLTNIETNMNSGEIVKTYQSFISRGDWRFTSSNLPVKTYTRDLKVIQEPTLEACRALLNAD